MGLFQAISGIYNRVRRAVSDTKDFYTNLPQKVQENQDTFKDVFETDWSNKTSEQKEVRVEEIKHRVIHDLIPAAGQLTLFGVPGILIYTPCQIAGALAVARVYDPGVGFTAKYMWTVAGIMVWGRAGEITWTRLIEALLAELTPPGASIAVIPFVQAWTEVALNVVHSEYRPAFRECSPSPTTDKAEAPVEKTKQTTHQVEGRNVLPEIKQTTHQVESGSVLREAKQMISRLEKGGKVLFPAQKEVFQELIESGETESALLLGRTHVFRGVAGSGKTVILGQLVPHIADVFIQKYERYPNILIYHHNNYIRQLLHQEIQSAMQAPLAINPLPNSLHKRIIHIHTLSTLYRQLEQDNILKCSVRSHRDSRFRANQICQAIQENHNLFDIVFIDEGQDISREEFDLLSRLSSRSSITDSSSWYIFYDEFQNIFEQKELVINRIPSQDIIEHYISRCVRTSKKIMDFTFNTCLGSSMDQETATELEKITGVEQLQQKQLLTKNHATDGKSWIDCQFCVFPGTVIPEVNQFWSNSSCFSALSQDLDRIFAQQDYRKAINGGILIICFSNSMVKNVYSTLHQKFGDRVKRRSGQDIYSKTKRSVLAVEPMQINVSLIWDVKGYDADIVYIINPDSGRASVLRKRIQFYVAATRAKQFLAVYSSIPEKDSPIMQDAQKAVQHLKQIENS